MYLIASHTDHGEIIVVSGRQIVTAEKLEILAIGTRVSWEDGLDASDVIESVLSSGAIPVLPWGFGKWLGRRGQEVRRLVEQFSSTSLYLGDNSGRPDVLPGPSIFAWARELGNRILRGSDPLPFAAECGRAGSFGFYVKIPDRGDDIWPTLRRNLQSGDCELNNYGSLESPCRFVRNQIAMQFRKRLMSHRVSI